LNTQPNSKGLLVKAQKINSKKNLTQRHKGAKNTEKIKKAGKTSVSIGTKNESSLHKTLKFRYTGKSGKTEVETEGFVADGIRDDGEFIEVQTGSFGPLKKKVKAFVSLGKVRIIHPIAVINTIEVYNTKGKLLYRRKSPVRGSHWDIFEALLSAPEIPLIKGLTIELTLVDITEKRIKDGKGSWRRKGISKQDKLLSAYHSSIVLSKKSDYLKHFVPFKKNEEFTVSSHAEKTGIKRHLSQKALYVLTKMKAVKRIGKKSNAWVYVR